MVSLFIDCYDALLLMVLYEVRGLKLRYYLLAVSAIEDEVWSTTESPRHHILEVRTQRKVR